MTLLVGPVDRAWTLVTGAVICWRIIFGALFLARAKKFAKTVFANKVFFRGGGCGLCMG